MPQKTINTRVQLKNDTEANWNKAGPKDGSLGFVPLRGELIIYSADDTHAFSRLKVGDGTTNVVALPFIDAGTINGSLLPGDSILLFNTTRDFPRSGESNKLYVDLANNRIFCFSIGVGYTQLSHFTYQITTQTIKSVKSWSAGTMTLLSVEDNKLQAENGTAPELETEDVVVITNFTETSPEVINNGGND